MRFYNTRETSSRTACKSKDSSLLPVRFNLVALSPPLKIQFADRLAQKRKASRGFIKTYRIWVQGLGIRVWGVGIRDCVKAGVFRLGFLKIIGIARREGDPHVELYRDDFKELPDGPL